MEIENLDQLRKALEDMWFTTVDPKVEEMLDRFIDIMDGEG